MTESAWNPLSADVLRDPANGYRHLLQRCPVHRFAEFEPPFYTLSRYGDVEAALRDIETFSSEFGQGPRFTPPQGMLCDPPQHTFYRSLVQRAFTPKLIEALRPRVTAVADELIDAFPSHGEVDLHDAFAFPLPVIIIAELLGVPARDMERFKHWSDIQVTAMGAADPTPYLQEQADFFLYLQSHFRARRAELAATPDTPSDVLGILAVARDETGDLLPEQQLLSVISQLLVGGNETTTSLITNAVWRLLQFGLWSELASDLNLVEAAIEESLRFDPPVLSLWRNTTRDVSVADVTIPTGSKVCLHYAAANRDPDTFDDPDRFDLHRPRKRHLSFGLGVHFCLGAPMARLEAEVALTALLRRWPALQLVNAGERIAPFFLWGRKRLPVRRS